MDSRRSRRFEGTAVLILWACLLTLVNGRSALVAPITPLIPCRHLSLHRYYGLIETAFLYSSRCKSRGDTAQALRFTDLGLSFSTWNYYTEDEGSFSFSEQ